MQGVRIGGLARSVGGGWQRFLLLPLLLLVLPLAALAQPRSGVSHSEWLGTPSNSSFEAHYDPATGTYVVYEKIGNRILGRPRVVSAEEYRALQREEQMRNYWRSQRSGNDGPAGGGLLPKLRVGGKTFDKIFGTNEIEIIPQGSAEVLFGIINSKTENYTIQEDMRSNTTFDFQAKLAINLVGRIGDKLRLDVKYNTEATFDFEQNVKLEYTGYEDEIIQKIEAGNVSMPLPGTLIQGSQNLFGIKTALQFGRLTMTSIFSQRKGQSQTIEVKGGAQTRDFEVRADEYEANRHFFLSQYFYENYDASLRFLPLISSGVEVTKLEVWVTNKQGRFDDSRDLLAFVDLGEPGKNIYAKSFVSGSGRVPSNGSNNLYEQMSSGAYAGARTLSDATALLSPLATSHNFRNGQDYEKLENARLLSPSEYTLNPKLGYISLNVALNNDEVLAVAYEYTIGGRTYKVGDLTHDGVTAPQALYVKLLKGTELSPNMPTWHLMMKNIYSIGAYQMSPDSFTLDVLYQDDEIGTPINYLTRGACANTPLLSVLGLDNLNGQQNAGPDGVFDYIEGVTVESRRGRIIFPVVEPFGRHLAAKLGDVELGKEIAYTELYDSTLSKARQVAEKNKFVLKGEYRTSSSNEIPLNAPNVPRGSVMVTAGGRRLEENVDYVVDYLVGTVKIINQGLLESGTPIKISLESNLGFDLQVKSLLGTHFDYKISDRMMLGATVMNLSERPFTKKVNYGGEAVSNTIWGLNFSYEQEAPWLTKAVDFLPFLDTKEPSSVSIDAEVAHFIPGQSRHMDKRGSVYLDDFEANKSQIDLRMWSAWSLASTPQGLPMFPEGSLVNDLRYGYNRARLAWYSIDPLFLRNSSLTPKHIRNNPDAQSSHLVREVEDREIFPNRNTPQGLPTTIPVLNMAFYPAERGPYNFDAKGVNADGTLQTPAKRWGGMMRSLPVTDFEQSNIEYVEFWLMDPFVEGMGGGGGDLYIDLGNVSEDVLRDGQKFFENGLPVRAEDPPARETAWGRVPGVQSTVLAFDNDPEARKKQDVGLDGLSSTDEQLKFTPYLEELGGVVGAEALARAQSDPASDNFHYFRSSAYDEQEVGILDRYKYFNNTEGNSPTAEQSPEDYPTSATTIPDVEDVNRDNTLSDNESYYHYRVELRPESLEVGRNYVSDRVIAKVKLANGNESEVAWYQFKVPVKEFAQRVGYIEDFKSIRFMRMYLKGFDKPVVLRFATLALVRGEWRRYERSLLAAHESLGGVQQSATLFDVSAVNIEENAHREPVNYVLPPDVTREIDATQAVENELNEQSMMLSVQNLGDGDARAAFKNVGYDLRDYKRIAMDVHAEAIPGQPLQDGELTLFLRLGSDYTNNYYEYEVPLRLTPPGVYSNNRDADRLVVWPAENAIDVDMELFRSAKLERDAAYRGSSGALSVQVPYSVADGARRVTVVGHPTLSSVKVLMIGVRNPKGSRQEDDGNAKSGVVWVNELRLSKIADKGGVAALLAMNARMADFGNVSVTGRVTTAGFGGLEDRVQQRVKEDSYEYDVSANMEFGKFFPSRWQVSIPLYVGYGQRYVLPKYNPLDEDIKFRDALRNLDDQRERDSLRRLVLDVSEHRSVNLTNVRVNQGNARAPKLYDPSNFSFDYAYTEQRAHNVKTEYRREHSHRGGMAYVYNAPAKSVEPFRRVAWMRSNYLALIRDLNFSPLPRQLSFRTEMDRRYGEQQLRNLKSPMLKIAPTYAKSWEWRRTYGLSWDLMRSLRFDFSADNLSTIDEPEGAAGRGLYGEAKRVWRDSVLAGVRRMGRNKQYNHRMSANYNVPLNKIPGLGWLTATANYTTEFRWEAAPLFADSLHFKPGNTLQNSQTNQLMAQANLVSLYSMVPYLERVNRKFDRFANGQPMEEKVEYKEVRYEQERFTVAENRARTVTHNLQAEDVKVEVYNVEGQKVESSVEEISNRKLRVRVKGGVKRGKVVVTGRKPQSSFTAQTVLDAGLRLLMSVRSVSVSRSETRGTFVPGYLPSTMLLGFSGFKNAAPGGAFVFGVQDSEFGQRAAERGWLSADSSVQDAYKMTRSETWNYRVTVEPFPYMRIEVSGNRTFSQNRAEYYRQLADGEFHAINPQVVGSFSITGVFIATAFDRATSKTRYESAAFTRFREGRLAEAQRLAEQRAAGGVYKNVAGPDGVFPEGYGALSPAVLVPTFLSAYMGGGSTWGRALFPKMPLPNWQFTYDGLSRIAAVRGVLRQLSLRHGYRANYTIGAYESNDAFMPSADGFSYATDVQGNFIGAYNVNAITISEQFSPLVGVDLGFVNQLTAKAEVRKNRTLTMSFANNQLTDMDGWELVVGAGYRFENLPLLMKTQLGGRKVSRSELRLQADFGMRETKTILRKLVEGTNTPTAGMRNYTIKFTADYMLSEQITLRMYFDHAVNKPLVSLSFPNSNTSFGVSARFVLEQ